MKHIHPNITLRTIEEEYEDSPTSKNVIVWMSPNQQWYTMRWSCEVATIWPKIPLVETKIKPSTVLTMFLASPPICFDTSNSLTILWWIPCANQSVVCTAFLLIKATPQNLRGSLSTEPWLFSYRVTLQITTFAWQKIEVWVHDIMLHRYIVLGYDLL